MSHELLNIINKYVADKNDLKDILKQCEELLRKTPEIINVVDDANHSALHIACSKSRIHGTLEFVKLLLNNGIDVNMQDTRGWTALHVACCNSRKDSNDETVELLLAHHKINVNLQDNCGESPLHTACQYSLIYSTERTVELLLAHPSTDVNLQNCGGKSPLHIACRYLCTYSTERTVELLLSHHKININLQDKRGESPLHSVCISSDEDTEGAVKTMELLLTRPEINVNVQDICGRRLLHILFQKYDWKHMKKIAELLLSHPKIEIFDDFDVSYIKGNNTFKIMALMNEIKNRQIAKLKADHERQINALNDSPYPGDNYIKTMMTEGVEFGDEMIAFWVDLLKKRIEFLKNIHHE